MTPEQIEALNDMAAKAGHKISLEQTDSGWAWLCVCGTGGPARRSDKSLARHDGRNHLRLQVGLALETYSPF